MHRNRKGDKSPMIRNKINTIITKIKTLFQNDVKKQIDTWSEYEKDQAYRYLWLSHVIADVETYMTEYLEEEKYLTQEEIEYIAYQYVYECRYDCNNSYWQNLESLIDEIIDKRKTNFVYQAIK